MNPHESEWGPFPQYALFITTERHTARHDMFSPDEAARSVADAVALMLSGASDGVVRYTAVTEPIRAIRLVRIDSVADFAALPSIGG